MKDNDIVFIVTIILLALVMWVIYRMGYTDGIKNASKQLDNARKKITEEMEKTDEELYGCGKCKEKPAENEKGDI